MKYIPAERLEAAMAADPVPRFRARLIDTGVCTDDELARLDEGAVTAVEEALRTALAAPVPAVDELDGDVYASPIAFPG